MNDNLQSIADNFTSIYLPQEIIINLILSFILGLIISVVYKFTHKGLSYSQSFMITNVFVAVIVCMVIMIIGNSLATFGTFNRPTVVKDTKILLIYFGHCCRNGFSNGNLAISGQL